MNDGTNDTVELDLPLTARYAATVRAVAASLASAVGMSVDDIDDLRLGVNEAISVLTDVDDPAVGDGRLHVRFETGPGRIAVAAGRSGADSEPAVQIDVLAQRILSAVVDEFSIDADGKFLLVKRVSTDGDA